MQQRKRPPAPVEFRPTYHLEALCKVELKCLQVLFIDVHCKRSFQGSCMLQHLAASTMAPLPRIHEQGFYGILVQCHETDRSAGVVKDPDLQTPEHFVPNDRHEGINISDREEGVRRQH